MQKIIISVILCCIALLTACNTQPDRVVMSDVNVAAWHEMATLTFQNKAIERCDMNVILHVNRHLSANEIALLITTFTPDSLRHTEQVTLPVEFTWSQPTATSADVELAYRRNVELKHKGEYIFQITPIESIKGVEAVGINFHDKNR